MTIEEAKIDLEKHIIFWDGVTGVGVVNENNALSIEIAIDKRGDNIQGKLNELIKGDLWKGHLVKIVESDNFRPHSK